MNLTFDEMYSAIGKQGTSYEGIFFTAVKSTKIFCRPSCRARKPLAKNVTFYASIQEVLKNGYRPCKVCRPMENENETPQIIKDLIRDLHEKPYEKIKDFDLRQRGIEPATLRRWFNKHHKMTFQAYQRLIRINLGYHQIQSGKKVSDAAFENGYESLSGFNEGFKSLFGKAPTELDKNATIMLDRFTSKLGPMFIGATSRGICLVEFSDRKMLETEFKDLRKRLASVIVPGENSHIKTAKKQLTEYFEGNRKSFSVSLDTPGTEFQREVWKGLENIPYGKTSSYKNQAIALNRPNSVRAVANANGLNRVPIIIPCHRVIGSDGSLTGYGGGLPRKKWLLDHEKRMSK